MALSSSQPEVSIIKSTPASTDSLIKDYSAVKSSDEDESAERRELRRKSIHEIKKKKVKRTVDDGLSIRQKILVIILWIISVFLGIMISYPEKIFGLEVVSQIKKDALDTPNSLELHGLTLERNSSGGFHKEDEESMSICVIKNGS
ncbi:unnamed protein product [Lepeophtheirus salmonis]|uniref:(salmon louse) hypothetical protein n=1 Tax=Lepeophtheirus salmonis TaxID=72036 RepID=A0A7R8CLL2_LEPSM|nr:unnamed protein product [Lepeophtheirus salmonis]CAF2859299.1 unnamed protein product [Lepeophtheirus salmonis]